VSDLLGDMNLLQPLSAAGGLGALGAGFDSAREADGSGGMPHCPPGSTTSLSSGCGGGVTSEVSDGGECSAAAGSGPGLSQAEADRMQREADSYVQVITAGEEPCQIVWASEAWLRLCEYTAPQVLGHTLELIQGPLTDRQSVTSLMNAIRRGDPITLSMINHTRTGKPFSHTLRVEPLRDSQGRVQCFQATSSNIDTSVGRGHLSNPPSRSESETMLNSLGADLSSNNLSANLSGGSANLSAASPALTTIREGEGDLSGGSNMKRSASNMSISGMLPRTGSELQISEMLDLWDQQGNQSGHGTPRQTPQSLPTIVSESALPPDEPLPLAAGGAAGAPPDLPTLLDGPTLGGLDAGALPHDS